MILQESEWAQPYDKLELVVASDDAAAAVSAIEEMRGEPSMNILWDFLRHLLDDDRLA